MLQITLLAVGRLKEEYLRSASLEYQKRLTPFCNFEIKEIDSCKIESSAIEQEGKRIISMIPKGSFVIALSGEGKGYSSEEFSHLITSQIPLNGKHKITFIIGGSFGLSDSVKKQADLILSFSHLTFPHQLFRVMLLEQIYRAFSIQKGMKYHK